jgi:hypothetical protein
MLKYESSSTHFLSPFPSYLSYELSLKRKSHRLEDDEPCTLVQKLPTLSFLSPQNFLDFPILFPLYYKLSPYRSKSLIEQKHTNKIWN